MSSSLFRQTLQRVRSGGQTVLIAPPSNWVAVRKFSRFATRFLSLARTALLLVLLVQASTPSLAQDVEPDTQIGNFLFKMPTGWNPVEKGRALVVYAPSPPTGTVTYFALASAEMNGDLQNSFREVWRGFTNTYRILEGSATQSYQSNRRYDALYTNAIVADQNGVRWYVYVLGAQYKKRIQTVLFMTNLPPGSAFIASFGVFKHTVLASLSFGDSLPGLEVPAAEVASSTEVPHELPPGALEGIYAGFGVDYGRLNLHHLNFSPDGWVIKEFPQEGMIGFDFTAYRNASSTNRSWIGRYRVEGDKVSILWQDYADDRQVIVLNETSFSPGLDSYVPMCRCTGKKFAGKYNYGLATSGRYLQFFLDGTFLDNQVLDQMLVPNAFYDHPRRQRGTYSIQNQTMIFTFADGRRGTRTFYAPRAQESGTVFDWIGLGWHTLHEEHHVSAP